MFIGVVIIIILLLYCYHLKALKRIEIEHIKEMDAMRANFAIYHNAAQNQILFLKDKLNEYECETETRKEGGNFANKTMQQISGNLQTDILKYQNTI